MYPEKISIDIGDISESIIKDIAYIHSTLTYREIELVNKFRVRLTPWDKDIDLFSVSIIHFECLQTVRYMILWSYQDKGYTRYKIFADGENCPHCNEMNRKEFLISSAQPYVNFIPFHPNCNCNAGIIDEKGDVVCWLSNDDISKNKENQKLLGEILTEYLKRTWETFILGDFSDESPTALTTVINILLGIADLDIPMDIRDFAASIIKHDGSFEDWVNLALNTAAFIPMIGSVKYTDEVLDTLKPAAKNRIADGVKGVIKSDIADNVDDIGKAAVKNSDEIKDEIIRDGSHIKNGILKPNVTYQTGEHEYIYKTNERGLISNVDVDDLKLKVHEGRRKHNGKTLGKKRETMQDIL